MWAIGNEVDLFYNNFRVWDIEEIKDDKRDRSLSPNNDSNTGIDPPKCL